ERCLSGDDAAWEDMVKTHTRRVYAVCYRFTGKDSEAQDLTQEVFLRVFRTLKTFRAGEGSFVVWLTRVTRNLLIDNYRRTRLERATDSIEDDECRLGRSVTDFRPQLFELRGALLQAPFVDRFNVEAPVTANLESR
ncbi:MAG: RNA polymerase sigma factor, partial [Candidatus Binataceae bacterium]